MGAIKAIFVFLSEALGLTNFLVRRGAAKADDPIEQNRKRYEQSDKDISERDSAAATSHAGDDLDQLERLRNTPKSGQQ
jgi:hypothetical protein